MVRHLEVIKFFLPVKWLFMIKNTAEQRRSEALHSCPGPLPAHARTTICYHKRSTHLNNTHKMATKRKCEEENNLAELSHKADGPSSDIHTSYQYEYSQKDESQSQEYYFAQYYEQRGDWAAFFDWNTSCYFYQNTTDFTVQWEQPDEWTSLPPKYLPISDLGSSVNPINSFETGSQTINYVTEGCLRRNARDIEAKNSEYLQRPSKRQTDPEESKKVHWIPEGATEYNIWYDRWVGEQWRRERDSGRNFLLN